MKNKQTNQQTKLSLSLPHPLPPLSRSFRVIKRRIAFTAVQICVNLYLSVVRPIPIYAFAVLNLKKLITKIEHVQRRGTKLIKSIQEWIAGMIQLALVWQRGNVIQENRIVFGLDNACALFEILFKFVDNT